MSPLANAWGRCQSLVARLGELSRANETHYAIDQPSRTLVTVANTSTAPHSVKPSTQRVRRYRERRRKGICSLTVELPKADIEEAIGGLKPDYDALDVLDAYYADVLDLLCKPCVRHGIGMAYQEQGYQARAAW